MQNDTFAALGCAEPYLTALDKRGFDTPTPVQAACFGPGVEGRDLVVQSRTGSGKTLAFGLPLLHRLDPQAGTQALILAPTRELAQQVAAELRSVHKGLGVALLVGGVTYVPQFKALQEKAPIVVGTPGRVLDHLERGTLDLSGIRMVVLDECDEMLNMGFIEDVDKILGRIQKHPQTYLFSATLPGPVANLADRFLKDPVRLQLSGAGGATAHADILHTPCLVADHHQEKALVNLLLHDRPERALVFTKTKQQTEVVAEALRAAGLAVEHLHGDLHQGARTRTLGQFKAGRLQVLVATDVAARGIDIEGLPLVVHMGIPTQLESYIHRSGRTGRAGAKGTTMALVGPKESRILKAWARRANLDLQWRRVPTPAEIRTQHEAELLSKLSAPAPNHMAQAIRLMQEQDAETLVAGLLAMVSEGKPSGFDIPADAFRSEESRSTPRKPWGTSASSSPRPGFSKPYERKDSRPSKPGDKPWKKEGPSFKDRPSSPAWNKQRRSA